MLTMTRLPSIFPEIKKGQRQSSEKSNGQLQSSDESKVDLRSRRDEKLAIAVRRLKCRLLPLLQHPKYGPLLDLSTKTLKKWLDVSSRDVFGADSKIRRHLEFRDKMKMDKLLTSYKVPKILLHYPAGLCGIDRQGSPVYYELFGLMTFDDILQAAGKQATGKQATGKQAAGKQALVRYKLYQHEKILEHLKDLTVCREKDVDSILLVVDVQFCQKIDISPGNIKRWAEILQMLLDNYPTLIKEIIVINVPDLPRDLHQACTSCFSREAWSLMTMYDNHFLRELRKKIPHQELPVYLRGQRELEPNLDCGLRIHWNVKMPYVTMETESSTQGPVQLVGAGVLRVEEYHVAAPDSQLTWLVEVEDNPVTFSVGLNVLGDNHLVCQPVVVSRDTGAQSGCINCHVTGRYLALLDNTRNSQDGARVRYKVTVTPPGTYMTQFTPMVPLGELCVRQLVFWSAVLLVSWSAGLLVSWSLGQLVSWSLGQLVSWSAGLLVSWSLGQLVSWSLGQLVSWSAGLLVSWSLGQLVSWSAGLLVSWSLGQLVSWSAGLLVSWSLGQLVSWSAGLLVSWSLGQLVSWSAGQLVSWSAGLLVSWSLGQLVSWSLGQLVSWSAGQLVSWSAGLLVSWSLGQLVSWSLGQLVSWSAGLLVSWSLGQLVSWSAGLLVSWSLGQLVSWSAGLLVSWSLGQLVSWSAGLLVSWSLGQLVSWSAGLLVSWSLGQLVSWSAGLLVSWSLGQLVSWSAGLLVSWSAGLLVSWSLGQLVSWSAGQLVSWSAGLLVSWSAGLCPRPPPPRPMGKKIKTVQPS
ncbi:uncharacterized protein LOC131947018 [Physella acuta]|uniref:uncharacterized protein LOC131947018 n=1 Tax=Physella acuta TaxID=109671 RepID=UPI0027DE1F5A|nr:uncharacterized protein LOC131947018 [Physella acuta]